MPLLDYKYLRILVQRRILVIGAALVVMFSTAPLFAVPMVLHYQGHLIDSGKAVEGDAAFKFALLDSSGVSVWSHDGTSVAGSEPSSSITLTLRRGVYSVRLGDVTLTNMQAITPAALAADQLFLRIWFNGGSGVQLLSPDQTISSVAFALRAHSAETAESLPDGLVEEKHLKADLLTKITNFEQQIAALTTALTVVSNKVDSTALDQFVAVSTATEDPALVGEGFELISTLNSVEWVFGAELGEPAGRAGHSGIWTGSQFMVWGGIQASGAYFGSGASYDFDLKEWAGLSPIDAPSARAGHSTVWTGSEMIVWGGVGLEGWLQSGGRYHNQFQFWSPLPTASAPTARSRHVAAWTGTKMLIWGGEDGGGPLGDHGIYDLASNSWSPLVLNPTPNTRSGATGVWTGDTLIIWGGEDLSGFLSDGSILAFSGGAPTAWAPIGSGSAPSARIGHAAVWTGAKMIVWGGENGTASLGDGAVFDPVTDSWAAISLTGAPAPRHSHGAVWTGSEMIVHAGRDAEGPINDSFAYDPVSDSWRKLAGSQATARSEATTIWTGTHVLTYGGFDSQGNVIPWLEYLEPVSIFHLFSKP